ncbi:universal stress protein [Methylobacterium brachiatum]
MTICNIMVSVDLGATAADRIQLAAGIAERFEAKLTGVAARQIVTMIPVESPDASERIFAIEEQRAREDLAEARALFEREAGTRVKTAWRSALAEPLSYLIEQARAADLVVLGRRGPGDGDPGLMDVPVGALLMEVGRPILVAPPGVERLAASRIVVAWKDTREARRAVHDALPFLIRADRVHVAVVGAGAGQEGAADVAAYLSGHGVHVSTHLLHQPETGAADELRRFARREEADLIVMGAYGHSRLREWILGGATRDMLQGTSLCCLMSH